MHLAYTAITAITDNDSSLKIIFTILVLSVSTFGLDFHFQFTVSIYTYNFRRNNILLFLGIAQYIGYIDLIFKRLKTHLFHFLHSLFDGSIWTAFMDLGLGPYSVGTVNFFVLFSFLHISGYVS